MLFYQHTNLITYLKHILKGIEKLEIYNNENELRLLWECCQIPDFVKKTYGNHLEVVGKVFNFLREILNCSNFVTSALSNCVTWGMACQAC